MSIESCPSREWLQGTKFLYSGPRGHSPCCCNVLLAAWCWHKAKRNVKITAITKTVLSYRKYTNDSLLIPLMLNKVSFQWVKTYRTWWWHQIYRFGHQVWISFHLRIFVLSLAVWQRAPWTRLAGEVTSNPVGIFAKLEKKPLDLAVEIPSGKMQTFFIDFCWQFSSRFWLIDMFWPL